MATNENPYEYEISNENFDEDFDEDYYDESMEDFDEEWDAGVDVLDVLSRLEDSVPSVRYKALETLRELDPATLAQHAGAVVVSLKDSDWAVRREALETLRKLDPATLAQHAGAVVARLKDSAHIRYKALKTLGALEPATLAQHAHAVLPCLEHSSKCVREAACTALRSLPRYITTGYIADPRPVRSRLLGRLAWYRCRLRWRVQRLAFYWDALSYRPSGPGHARDVEAWGQMTGEGNRKPTTEGAREGGGKKKPKKYQ